MLPRPAMQELKDQGSGSQKLRLNKEKRSAQSKKETGSCSIVIDKACPFSPPNIHISKVKKFQYEQWAMAQGSTLQLSLLHFRLARSGSQNQTSIRPMRQPGKSFEDYINCGWGWYGKSEILSWSGGRERLLAWCISTRSLNQARRERIDVSCQGMNGSRYGFRVESCELNVWKGETRTRYLSFFVVIIRSWIEGGFGCSFHGAGRDCSLLSWLILIQIWPRTDRIITLNSDIFSSHLPRGWINFLINFLTRTSMWSVIPLSGPGTYLYHHTAHPLASSSSMIAPQS